MIQHIEGFNRTIMATSNYIDEVRDKRVFKIDDWYEIVGKIDLSEFGGRDEDIYLIKSHDGEIYAFDEQSKDWIFKGDIERDSDEEEDEEEDDEDDEDDDEEEEIEEEEDEEDEEEEEEDEEDEEKEDTLVLDEKTIQAIVKKAIKEYSESQKSETKK